jgi:hypothetical protein
VLHDDIRRRLARLEAACAPLDGVGLIAPSEAGWCLHLGWMHKDGFASMEEAENYFDLLRETGRTRADHLIVVDL